MKPESSRRRFLATGLALPAAGLAKTAVPPIPALQGGNQQVKLEFRTLGKTGLKVTTLGFGCMTTSDPTVIERAADIGINYFDTARSYQGGNNERMVGAALKRVRPKIVLSSKSGGKTAKAALDELDTSLRQLGTDYLDIWYLHNRNEPAEVTDELLEAQQQAKKAGKIRFAGVSCHFNMDTMLDHLVKRGQTDVTLVSYNFTLKPEIGKAIERARAAGMGVVGMKVLAGGLSRIARGDRLYGVNPQDLTGTLKQPGAMLAAIKWAFQNKSLDTAIVCMADFDQLDENLRAMAEPFTPSDRKLLAAHLATISPVYCRMCGECGGTCDRGVPVPDMLRFMTYVEGYGQFAMARERFLELPQQVREIRCSDCTQCSVQCPNGVQVRDRIMHAQEMLA